VGESAYVSEVAKATVKVVEMPFGARPFCIHIDPAQDGAEIVNGVADRARAELFRNMDLADLLRPTKHSCVRVSSQGEANMRSGG
jgi:hypothetical protein